MKLEAGYAVVLTNHVSDAVTDDAAGVGGGFLQAAQLRRLVVAARAGPRRGDLSRARKVLGCPK